MTTTSRTTGDSLARTCDALARTCDARRHVAAALASCGVVVADVDSLDDGREWVVTVTHRPAAMSSTGLEVAVWTAVLTGGGAHGLPEPAEGVRVRADG